MSEFNEGNISLTKIAANLVAVPKIEGVFGIEKLKAQLASLPDEGVLYRVEFGVADITSNDFLTDPNRFPDMWGENGYRGIFPSSESLTKTLLIDYLAGGVSTLPQKVTEALEKGIPFGIRIRAWQAKEGLDPNMVEASKGGSVVEIASATIARNLK